MVVERYAERRALDRLPEPIRNAPELRLGLGLYYQAFWDLNSCRQVGLGDGPISWHDVEAYGVARGLDEEQRDDLHAHIGAMDGAYRTWRAQKAKAGNG